MQEKVSFMSGTNRLAGILHLPARENAPAIVFAHGFTMDKENKHSICTALEEKGFAVLRFDAAGCGDSGGSFYDFTISRYIADARAAFEFLASHSAVDKNRIGMTGHSMGGFVSIASAAQNPRLRAIVSADAPFSFVRGERGPKSPFNEDFVAEWKKDGEQTFMTKIKGARVPAKLSYNYMIDAARYDDARLIARVKCPVMIIHGSDDSIVPMSQARALFESANEPKELLIAEGVDHNYRRPEDEKFLADAMIRWFSKYL